MKHTLKKISDTKVELTIKLNSDDLAAVRPLTLTRLAKEVKVPGFRAGKVPASVAEKNIDPSTLETQVLEDAINKYVIDAINTEDLRPLERPEVDIKSAVPKQSAEFTAEFEVLPEIKLGDYKKLKVTKEKLTVAQKDIDEVLERMRQGFAEKKEVKRAAKLNDEVWIDFDGTDKDGKAVAGASGQDYPLKLGSGTFIPGFEEGLVGKKAGETFDLPLTFPKDYHHEPLKGAKITFKVTVKKVTEVALPELNDEFAAKCGPFTSVADLKEDIKSELTAQKQREADDKLKDALVEQLVKTSTVPVPESLVHDQMHALEQDAAQNLMYRGMTVEQYMQQQGYKDRHEWLEAELREAAIRRVQSGLALSELTKAEGIEVSQDELNERLSAMLEQYKDPKVRAQLDTPEARRDIANRVLTEKTVDRLVELNK